jgi:hypothetical protein
MAFRLGKRIAGRAAHAEQPIAGHVGLRGAVGLAHGALRGAAHLGAAGFGGADGGGFRFSDLPGFGGGLPQPAANDPGNNAAEQLKIQQNIYALMTGQGINVIVKNPNPQSTFS